MIHLTKRGIMILVTEEQKDDPHAIRCIGIDRKQHLYYAWDDRL